MFHLIEHLNRDRFTPFCIVPREGELSENLRRIGCKCFTAPLLSIKPRHLFELPAEVKAIRRIISENDIHIISPDRDADTFLCGIAKRKTSAKLVWHVRVNGGNNKDKWNSRLSDGIIGVSNAVRNRFTENHLDGKYSTIYNGVDTTKFSPPEDKEKIRRELGIPDGRFILIFVGQIKIGKGILDLTDAVSLLRDELGQDKLPAVYYIGTTENYTVLNTVKEKIASMGLSDVITMTGQRTDVHKWMQAADALIIPSHEGVEGLPRVLYEAMACGAVGIGSNTSGVREAVLQESGILVKEKSPREIADAVITLINDPEYRAKLQMNGRKRAVETFDIRIHARKVEDFYLKILGMNK